MTTASRLAAWRLLLLADKGEPSAPAQVVLDDIRQMANAEFAALVDGQGRVDPMKLAMKEGALTLVAAIERRLERAAKEHAPVGANAFAVTTNGEAYG